MEDADPCHSGGTGFDTHFGASQRDSAECQDGDGVGGPAGFAKGLETCCGTDSLASDDLAEDRGKENGVRCGGACPVNLFETVAGNSDDGIGEAGGGVAATDFLLGDGSMTGTDVDPVGPRGDGGLNTGIDKDDGAGRRRDLKDASGDVGDIGGGKVFFADLNDLDALVGPAGSLLHERGDAFVIVTRKYGAVGDGASKHVDKFRREYVAVGFVINPGSGCVVVFRQRYVFRTLDSAG